MEEGAQGFHLSVSQCYGRSSNFALTMFDPLWRPLLLLHMSVE